LTNCQKDAFRFGRFAALKKPFQRKMSGERDLREAETYTKPKQIRSNVGPSKGGGLEQLFAQFNGFSTASQPSFVLLLTKPLRERNK
jgi:hypothetical protein